MHSEVLSMARSHTGATLAFFRVCCGTRSGPGSCLWLRCVCLLTSVWLPVCTDFTRVCHVPAVGFGLVEG